MFSTCFLIEKFEFLRWLYMKFAGGSVGTFPFVSVALLCFVASVLGLVCFKTNLFQSSGGNTLVLSGMVSVRGSVSLETLNLSKQEIRSINSAVEGYRRSFSSIDLVIDTQEKVAKLDDDTVLVFAMTLKTNGDLEIKSWSRKVERGKLVTQMVSYMNKAAKEYEEFRKFPDVQQNFKTLYI